MCWFGWWGWKGWGGGGGGGGVAVGGQGELLAV